MRSATVLPYGSSTSFTQTQLLVDFDNQIIAAVTGFPGHLHDSSQVRFRPIFRYILGNDFALADTGYAGVDFCVAGLRSNQLRTMTTFLMLLAVMN